MTIGPGFAIGVIVLVIALQFLFSALKESGHIRAPKFGRKSRSSFRQYPLHPPVQGNGEDIEIF